MQKIILLTMLALLIVAFLAPAPASAQNESSMFLFIPGPFGLMSVIEIPCPWEFMPLYDGEGDEGGDDGGDGNEDDEDDDNNKDVRPRNWGDIKAMWIL